MRADESFASEPDVASRGTGPNGLEGYEPWPFCRSCETYHDPSDNYLGDCDFDWSSLS